MNRTLRTIVIVCGGACFAAAAVAAFGWAPKLNPTGLALCGFGLWLASTAP